MAGMKQEILRVVYTLIFTTAMIVACAAIQAEVGYKTFTTIGAIILTVVAVTAATCTVAALRKGRKR
jgi:hypothetical protein